MRIKNHWLRLAKPISISIFVDVLSILSLIAFKTNNPTLPAPSLLPFVFMMILGSLPLVLAALQMSFTRYSLGDGIVRLEEGVFSRTAIDIPVNKINDMTVRQSLFQRMFGAGDLILMTGNDSGAEMLSIEAPLAVRDAIYERKRKS